MNVCVCVFVCLCSCERACIRSNIDDDDAAPAQEFERLKGRARWVRRSLSLSVALIHVSASPDNQSDGWKWQVEPTEGTLDRRGGPPQQFKVTYEGQGQPAGPTPGTLVIVLPNDNFSWTYKFQVSPP